MEQIANEVIKLLDHFKQSGQLNDYLIDDNENKWTKLIYDILINKFDMPFGGKTKVMASDIYNNYVVVWKGKNKFSNMLHAESKQPKNIIRLTEQDLNRIVKESVNRILKEGVEFSSENPQEEWVYYQNKLQDEFDELGVMVLNKIPRNDPDRQVVERYIKMIQAHLHALEN